MVVACMSTSMIKPLASAPTSAARLLTPSLTAIPKLQKTNTNHERNWSNWAELLQPRVTMVRNVATNALFLRCIN